MPTILVVEPDTETAAKIEMAFANSFEFKSFKVAHTTQEALAFVYQCDQVDFIISDINHQDIDCTGFFEELRQCQASANASIMAIADTVDRDSLVTAAAAGAVDFISRPININVLIAKFRRLLHETFQRSSERLAVTSDHEVDIQFDPEKCYPGQISDISLGGCQLKTTRFAKGGSVFDEVDLHIKAHGLDIRARAELVRMERLNKEEVRDDYIVSAGFQFLDLQQAQTDALQQLVDTLQNESK